MKKIIALFSFPLILLSQDFIESNGECKINWSDGYIYCQGESASGQQAFNAKRSAVIVAQRNLLETVKGVHIDSETTINNGMLENDTIKSNVEGAVRGVEVISNTYNKADGNAIATVKMHLGKDLLKALINEEETSWNTKIKKFIELLTPTKLYAGEVYNQNDADTLKKLLRDFKSSSDAKPAMAIQNILDGIGNRSNFTGILIDARKSNDFKNAINVKLVDKTGKEIYPSGFVSRKNFVGKNGSSVGYDLSIDDAIKNKRVFDHPLIIKAVSTYKNRKSDLILDDNDIKKVVGIASNSLKDAKIIIVMGE